MDVFEAVASRYSCRAFLPTPVPEKTVRDILERAGRAPSGGNVQPWRVHALSGGKLKDLRTIVQSRFDELPYVEGAEYDIYPRNLQEPYESRRRRAGVMLYQSIGVTRDDRAGRYRQYGRNFLFYDAPVGLFFSIDRKMGPPQWSDLGGFIQTVMLLARQRFLQPALLEDASAVSRALRRPHHLLRHGHGLCRRSGPDQFLAISARATRHLCLFRGL